MKRFFPAFICFVLLQSVALAEIVDYRKDVLPIMKERCWECHSNEEKVKGNLALDDFDEVRDYQIGKYNIIRPGNAEESNFLERLLLDTNDTDFMPRKAERIPEKEIEVIRQWISQGAVIDSEKPTEEEKEWVQKSSGGGAGKMDSATEFHKWTNRDGRTIEARFLTGTDQTVTIVMKNGKKFRIPLNTLDEKSVALAAELTAK